MVEYTSALLAVYPGESPEAALSRLEQAVLRTIAYADVFDYPLTTEEVWFYLVGVSATRQAVLASLHASSSRSGQAIISGNFVTLPGRERLVELRLERETNAAGLWQQACRYGNLISGLPYVRMLAVTGALAVENVDREADIDYLVVTAPDRLWVCRALVILVVHWAALGGVRLCPNYFLSQRSLEVSPHDLYTAHEIVQMVPISGLETYRALRLANRWTGAFLPNTSVNKTEKDKYRRISFRQVWGEWAFKNSLGSWLDRWEMERKIRKFARIQAFDQEFNFSPDWCRGHNSGHARKTCQAYGERLRRLNLGDPPENGR